MQKLVWSFVALVLIVFGACSGGDDDSTVSMAAGQRFDPSEISVTTGASITFSNDSDEAHTVTAYEAELPEGAAYFSSGGAQDEDAARDSLSEELVAAGESFELILESPGIYRYFCIPHEGSGMKGTITVE